MNRNTLDKLIVPFIAAGAVCFSLAAQAADTTTPAATTPTITKAEAKDLKTQSDAQFKARKKVADANADLGKADCDTALEGGVARACKQSVKSDAKTDKANAKIVHEAEKADIKAQQKAN